MHTKTTVSLTNNKNNVKYLRGKVSVNNFKTKTPQTCKLMLPAHFHDVTYDHIWSKVLYEITMIPTQNTRTNNDRILKSKQRAMTN